MFYNSEISIFVNHSKTYNTTLTVQTYQANQSSQNYFIHLTTIFCINHQTNNLSKIISTTSAERVKLDSRNKAKIQNELKTPPHLLIVAMLYGLFSYDDAPMSNSLKIHYICRNQHVPINIFKESKQHKIMVLETLNN